MIVPSFKFSVSLFLAQAISADFFCTTREKDWQHLVFMESDRLARSECSQTKSSSGNAIYCSARSEALGSVHIALLSCILLISQCFLNIVSEWASSPFLGLRGSSSDGREKKEILVYGAEFLPELHSCFRIALPCTVWVFLNILCGTGSFVFCSIYFSLLVLNELIVFFRYKF